MRRRWPFGTDRQRPPEREESLPQCLANIEYGRKVVAELEAKYPHLINRNDP